MAQELKFGIIGMSAGNGHPYSWSAIFNGYDKVKMSACPFPVIPEYLARQNFPADGLSHIGRVTHIWTQDKFVSRQIAGASNIEFVADKLEDMIGSVDAILLARDDGENHFEMAAPFLRAGLPIFIDKPLALSVMDAKAILSAQVYEGQVFTCSSLRYANELLLTEADLIASGAILHVEASIMKKWDTYGVHLIEPITSQLVNRGRLQNVVSRSKSGIQYAIIEWENLSAFFKTTADIFSFPEFRFYGEAMTITKCFTDSFSSFKASLEKFVRVISNEKENINREETLEIVEILERVRKI